MATKEYNEQQTAMINSYIRKNDVPLDEGVGMRGAGIIAKYFQVGGLSNYELTLMRKTFKGKSTSELTGSQEKINQLEKAAGIN